MSKKQADDLPALIISMEVHCSLSGQQAACIYTHNSHQKSVSGLNLFCCIYEKQKSQQGHCHLLRQVGMANIWKTSHGIRSHLSLQFLWVIKVRFFWNHYNSLSLLPHYLQFRKTLKAKQVKKKHFINPDLPYMLITSSSDLGKWWRWNRSLTEVILRSLNFQKLLSIPSFENRSLSQMPKGHEILRH